MWKKVRFSEEEKVLLEHYIRLSGSPDSHPCETDDDWQEWVAGPVITHVLAPRQARAVLEVVGVLADRGLSISDVLIELCKKYAEPFDA